jgi:hypothetical protein
MKSLFLPLCLLIASSAGAISNTFQSLLSQEATKGRCESLTTEQKAALDDYFLELEALSGEFNQNLTDLASQHEDALDALKEVLGADQLASQILFVPVKNQQPEFMDFDEDDDIFDDMDDATMVS